MTQEEQNKVAERIARAIMDECPDVTQSFFVEVDEYVAYLEHEIEGHMGIGGSDGETRFEPYFYTDHREIRVKELYDENDERRPDLITIVQKKINASIRR